MKQNPVILPWENRNYDIFIFTFLRIKGKYDTFNHGNCIISRSRKKINCFLRLEKAQKRFVKQEIKSLEKKVR